MAILRTSLIAASVASAAGDCSSSHLSAVSQHMKGSGVMKQHVESEGQPAMDMDMRMNVSVALDVEGLNLVESVQASTLMNNQTINVSIDQILNFEDRVIAQRVKTDGQDSVCNMVHLPELLPKELLMMAMQFMEKAYSCKGSADGMDTYGLDFPPSWLPVPSPVVIHAAVDVDENNLVHKESVVEDVDMKGTKAHVESSMVFDTVAAGGPKAGDLVIPKEWDCKSVDVDLEAVMLPADGRSMRAVGTLRKFLRAAQLVALEKSAILV